jgi:hypothetical protein
LFQIEPDTILRLAYELGASGLRCAVELDGVRGSAADIIDYRLEGGEEEGAFLLGEDADTVVGGREDG